MFSGIVEEVGQIIQVDKLPGYRQLTIRAKQVMSDLKLGDSIALNGVCLTVVNFSADTFVVQVVPETLSCTNISQLGVDAYVNLERSILPSTRIGGHFIQGHVDTICEFLGFEEVNQGIYGYFALPQELARYFIPKGYVSLDGMSLTIAKLEQDRFAIAFIPHTTQQTIVYHYKPGQLVNLEVDMVGKYLTRFEALEKAHGSC